MRHNKIRGALCRVQMNEGYRCAIIVSPKKFEAALTQLTRGTTHGVRTSNMRSRQLCVLTAVRHRSGDAELSQTRKV